MPYFQYGASRLGIEGEYKNPFFLPSFEEKRGMYEKQSLTR